jgi:phage terminase small subunit
MGRPRKSDEEKRREGNRGKRDILPSFVPDGAPFVAEHIQEDAKACVEHVLKSFRNKQMSSADSYALAAFGTAWAWHKAACEAMAAPDFKPIVIGSTGQEVPNPWFKVLNEQARTLLAFASRLYLTPADRGNLAADEPPKSKFDGLRGRTPPVQNESSPTLSS